MKLKPSNMKTIEQEKSDYLTRLMAKYAAEEPNLTELAMESFSLGVTFAQQWIPVDDELPENNIDFPFQKYLVLIEIYGQNYHATTATCATFECGNWITDRNDVDILEIKVTHWRPIELK